MEPKLSNDKLAYCKKEIEKGIRGVIEKSASRGVVVALSGGLDSSVVLKLSAEVVDAYALIMPEADVSKPSDIRDARELAKFLGVKHSIIEISDVVNSVNKVFPWDEFKGGNMRIPGANVKPRVRMIFNYLAANLDGRLVLGTGNRTELLLGYVTKYGDGACDFEPIGGLFKTQVIQLARYLKLPEKIIGKKPSAGLWRGQTDEEDLGASYSVIDEILHLLVDQGCSIGETARHLGLDMKLVKSIHQRMEGNMHKRAVPEIVELDL
jgi:NAD+ synthase